jgi:hypothetical protein
VQVTPAFLVLKNGQPALAINGLAVPSQFIEALKEVVDDANAGK